MVSIILELFITITFAYACTKLFIKSENIIERYYLGIVGSISFIVMMVYLVDSNNLITRLGYSNNINTSNWFNFLSQLISTALGVSISVSIALYQIKKESDENVKRDKENLRIQNLPIIKYEITSRTNPDHELVVEDFLVNTKYQSAESAKSYPLEIKIKNIGLNNIRKIKLELVGDCFDEKIELLGYDSLVPLEKETEEHVFKYLKLLANKDYALTLKTSYEDIMQNKYEQIVEIKYITTDIFIKKDPESKVEFKVKDEVLQTVQTLGLRFLSEKEKIEVKSDTDFNQNTTNSKEI